MFSEKHIRPLFVLVSLLAFAAQADVGPALSGITARADDASTVFWSPAGITRLDRPELDDTGNAGCHGIKVQCKAIKPRRWQCRL